MVIGAVLAQEVSGKEYIIAYLRRRLLDVESRYVFIEKLCLSLYYACTKFLPYLLSSTCVVACQADVIKYMLQRPILCSDQSSNSLISVLRCHPWISNVDTTQYSEDL